MVYLNLEFFLYLHNTPSSYSKLNLFLFVRMINFVISCTRVFALSNATRNLHVSFDCSTRNLLVCILTARNHLIISYFALYSERRPTRSELIILVAHNDDPTGLECMCLLV